MKEQNHTQQANKIDALKRRTFIKRCAACTLGLTALPYLGMPSVISPNSLLPIGKTKIKLILAWPDPANPIWPNIGYDFDSHTMGIKQQLIQRCPEVEFLPVTVNSGNGASAQALIENDKDVDGYLVYLAGCLWGDMTETIAASGKPTIIADHLYAGSGEFLNSFAAAKRAGHRVIGVSSSDPNDLVMAVKCIETLRKLRESAMLVVGGSVDESLTDIYGTRNEGIEFSEINQAYSKITDVEAQKIAGAWMSAASYVVEPNKEEIMRSAKMYLAMENLLINHQAQAITVNCLGGIYSGNMAPAYPCLGFMQLDDDGLVGACEADQRSAITKLLMTYLAGRPGFISDPVIDTSKNQIIYAHCVAPTKMLGPNGPSNPYVIRNHSEDRLGACNTSLMPLGKEVTTLQFDHVKKQVIMHQGITAEHVDEDMACRTKLAVEVKGDIRKLMNYWDQWGWHRVTFYGDHRSQIYNLADLLGFEVVEEA